MALRYIPRSCTTAREKGVPHDSQVKAMDVDNCEQVTEEEEGTWEEWYDPNAYYQDELNYIGKGGYKGKGGAEFHFDA